MMVSMGYVVPGALVVASDSHANMYGALGALGTPVVRTDAAAIWATGEFWWQIPRTVQVTLNGQLREGVTGKDVIVTLCGLYNRDEVLNAAVEFVGPGVAGLTIDARLSISNMTTEWGALVGWFPADAVTLRYLARRRAIASVVGATRFTDEDLRAWTAEPLASDPDANVAAQIDLDLGDVSPHVSGPDSVKVMRPVSDMEKDRIAIHKAYLVSCVNSRLEDLEAAAQVIRGKRVAPGVEFYVSAASQEVQQDAEASAAWTAFLDAGAKPLPPGCGPCIGLGAGLLEPGEVGISATNRNFKGRMGSREARCYLASPAVVAASAVAGWVTGPTRVDDRPLERHFTERAAAPEPDEAVAIQEGFPERVVGRLVFVPADNLNTDGIYGKDYTYREGMAPDEMARVVMENYDPAFAERTQAGDVLVGGSNFGTGSSREQAATALQAKGIPMVIAASFSQTYLRNAYNNGYPCIACPALVKRLKEHLGDDVAGGQPTIIPGDEIDVDFARSKVSFRGESFGFAALGAVPQSLVVAGGVERQVRKRLGLR
jgi:homoaconitate hydratase